MDALQVNSSQISTVKLCGWRTTRGGRSPERYALRSHTGTRSPFPTSDALGARLASVLRVPIAAACHERIRTLSMDRREALQLTLRLEASHHLLSHPRRLVRMLRAVVQSLVLPMFDVQAELAGA